MKVWAKGEKISINKNLKKITSPPKHLPMIRSFGSVFRATYKKTGNEVAIKEVIVNEDFMEILKEINIMKQCKSRYDALWCCYYYNTQYRYVVQYYGNYFKGDNCWIIMEYCAFGSVGDLLNLTDHPLSEAQISYFIKALKNK